MATQTHVIASSSVAPISTPAANGSSANGGSNHIIGGKFRVGKKIGEGSFGVVFEGEQIETHRRVAVKFEPRKSDAPQLRDEYRSYRTLRHIPGIPEVHHFGTEGLHNVLVIDLLGPNLEDLFDMCGRKFSVKTVCMLARQMISRVQSVHDKSLIYRDIKPDNFLIGPAGSPYANVVHLIDFGMAKHYRDPKTKQHIPYRERKSLSGTARYMSINTHLGREQSRRDDLESLGHVFMYFIRGGLPWQGLKAATNKQKYEKIGEKKQSVPISELCEGFPDEFSIYMNYVRKLGFEEQPDYDFLRELFMKVLKSIHETDDSIFDWMLLNGGKGWEYTQMSTQALQAALAKGDREREQRKRDREREKDRDREHADRDRDHHRRPSRAIDQSPTQNAAGSNTALVGGVSAQGILTPAAVAAAAQGKSSRRHTRDRDRERERERLGVSGGLGNADAALSVQPIPPSSRRGSQQFARGDSKTGLGGDLAASGSGLALPHPYANTNMNLNGMSPAGSTGAVNSANAGGYRTSNVTGSNSPLPPIPNDPRISGGNDSDGHTYLNNGNLSGYANGVGNGSGSPYLQGAQANSSMQRTKMMGFGGGAVNGYGNGNGAMREQMDEDGKERYGEHKGGFWSVLCCRA